MNCVIVSSKYIDSISVLYLSCFICYKLLQLLKYVHIFSVYTKMRQINLTLWSLMWVVYLFIVCEPERRIVCVEQSIFVGCWLCPPCRLSKKLLPICFLGPILNYVSICHCSCVVYCGNIRLSVCLLSARLTQIWPRTLMVRVAYKNIISKMAKF